MNSSENSEALSPEAEGIVGMLLRMRSVGLTSEVLCKAVESVPHDQFVPVDFFNSSWKNQRFPLACGQVMYSPDLAVQMISHLAVEPNHSVLEIGSGSGYMSALLGRLSKKVHSIDRYKTLLNSASERLKRLAIDNVVFEQADAGVNWTGQGLYDRIVVDSAHDGVPRHLLNMLVSGGIAITAIGEPLQEQMLVKLTKIGSRFDRQDLFPVRFGALDSGLPRSL